MSRFIFLEGFMPIEARSGSAHELHWNFLPRESASEFSACAPFVWFIYKCRERCKSRRKTHAHISNGKLLRSNQRPTLIALW